MALTCGKGKVKYSAELIRKMSGLSVCSKTVAQLMFSPTRNHTPWKKGKGRNGHPPCFSARWTLPIFLFYTQRK